MQLKSSLQKRKVTLAANARGLAFVAAIANYQPITKAQLLIKPLKYNKMPNNKSQAGTEVQQSTQAELITSSSHNAKPIVSGSEFRIVELDGVFNIEREFRRITKTGFFWWSKKVEDYVWKDITYYGEECYRFPMYGTGIVLDTYKYKMPEFASLDEAEKALNKLINPPQPVYHYR